ncbi:MAG: antibiotic biosynthesis monooxygenase [Ferruginibacter sp.]
MFLTARFKAALLLKASMAAFILLFSSTVSAQSSNHYMRIATIEIDSVYLEQYKAALREGIETAVQTEPGVLVLNAVYAKDRPTLVTVFEIYASEEAYRQHIQTAHFKKYKETVQHMVRSLVLKDVAPIALASKEKP